MQRANGTASKTSRSFRSKVPSMSIPADVKTILKTFKKVAVVGISANSSRPSHWIARYLIENGFDVIGVNPGLPQIKGIRVVGSLREIADPLEIVDIFRSPDAIPAIIEELKNRKPAVVWLQPGAENPDAEDDARAAGMKIISGRCIFADHKEITS